MTGEAGAGKSRLAWEFEKYLDGLADTIWVASAPLLVVRRWGGFWALAEVVRCRLQIAEGDPTSVADHRGVAAVVGYRSGVDDGLSTLNIPVQVAPIRLNHGPGGIEHVSGEDGGGDSDAEDFGEVRY